MAPFQRTKARLPALLVGIVALAAACGSAETIDEPGQLAAADGPQVADPRFDGEFAITALSIDGQDVELASLPLITIETEFGALTVSPGCNMYFGSFTLAESGLASFTIAGGSSDDCGALAGQETDVLTALEQATGWTEAGDGFTFTGPDISLTASPT